MTARTLTLSGADVDAISLALLDAIGNLRQAANVASRFGTDTTAIESRIVDLLALHRRVLGGES